MQQMTVFSGLALKNILEDNFMTAFIGETGCSVTRVYEPTAVLFDLVRQGERPDIIIGVTSSLAEMAADGYVHAESIRGLVRSEVGVAVGAGAACARLDTVDDFRNLIQRASSVAYSAAGASGGVFQRVLTELGLTDLVSEKAVVLAKGFTAEAVRDGRAEIAIQQISELAAVSGVDIVGPLPAELRAHVELSIAVGTHADNVALATRFSEYLRDDRTVPVYLRAFLRPIS